MKLKQAILQVLGRDDLKAIADTLEIEGVDRRSASDMVAALARAHRATSEAMLAFLSERTVKEVCAVYGIPSTGRRAALIEALLCAESDVARPESSKGVAGPVGGTSTPFEDSGRATGVVARPESSKGVAGPVGGTSTPFEDSGRATAAKGVTGPAVGTSTPFEDSGRATPGTKPMNDEAGRQVPAQPVQRLPEPPPGMMRVTRTELVWPGKYNDDGTQKDVPRVSLPFQVIETINESQATRQAMKKQPTLFDVYEGTEGDTFEAGWRNKLIWGDNLLVMGALLEKFAGKVDLIYIDPPFATGTDFSFGTQVGDANLQITKEQSIIEEKAYRDTWGRGFESYLQMMYSRLTLIKDLLSDQGSIYVHCDWRVSSGLRLIMDELGFVFENQISWKRSAIAAGVKTQWRNSQDFLLFYSRVGNHHFNPQRGEYSESSKAHYNKEDEKGIYRTVPLMASGRRSGPTGQAWRDVDVANRGKNGMHWLKVPQALDELDKEGKVYWNTQGVPELKYYFDEAKGVYISDFWDDIDVINSMATEYLDFPTQKPETLLTRILNASSGPGDLVADFFCGSGTTLAVAEKLGRRWIGCDLSRWAIHVGRKRLHKIEGCRPLEILNLGKYERQYWQGVTFAPKGKAITEQALYEYLAFILKLYGAQPLAGLAHLHGKKGKAMVHVGAVDAPVTIDEINAALAECVKVRQTELHVLGWEWEMGLYDLMVSEAKRQGVKLLLLQIPREVMEQQAVDKGDIQFFELAFLEVEIKTAKKLTAVVTLKDFVIPNTDLIPPDVRAKVKKWSDFIDYWAVDWNFQNDTFMQGWVTYRTRQDRALPLTSDSHAYETPGAYRVLVKVVDIFGNDTSQAFDVEVS